MLWDIPKEKILEMKKQTKILYHKYFSSVEKIVDTTLKASKVPLPLDRNRLDANIHFSDFFRSLQKLIS